MNKYEKLNTRTSKRYRIYKHISRVKNPMDINFLSSDFPVTIEIFPTGKCNINCTFCSYKCINNQNELNFKVFKNLIHEIIYHKVKSVVFSGGGEPTLHPYLPEAIHKLTCAGIKVGIITNGVYLSNEISKALLKYSWIRFSLNSYNKTKFSKITGNS